MRFLGYRGGESLDFDVLPSRPVHSDRWPILLLFVRRYHPLTANRTKFQNCFTYILQKKIKITLDKKLKKIVSMLLIYLFASVKLEKGHKLLGSSFKIMLPL